MQKNLSKSLLLLLLLGCTQLSLTSAMESASTLNQQGILLSEISLESLETEVSIYDAVPKDTIDGKQEHRTLSMFRPLPENAASIGATTTIITNITTNVTVQCPMGCVCNVNSTICQSCRQGFLTHLQPNRTNPRVMDRFCLKQCPMGTYPNFVNNNCANCTLGCDYCSETECLKCSPGFRSLSPSLRGDLTSVQQCVRSCPIRTVSINDTCLSCPANCLNCSSNTICNACEPYFRLANGTCVNHCNITTAPRNVTNQTVSLPAQFVDVDNKCKNCSVNCTSCQFGANSCLSCVSGLQLLSGRCINASSTTCPRSFFFNPSTRQCIPCPNGCAECRGPSQCTNCTQGFFRMNYTNNFTSICLSNSCPVGFRSNSITGVCEKCNVNNCTSCPSGVNTCSQCNDTFFLYRNNCTATCPNATFSSGTGRGVLRTCTDCPNGCLNCTNSTSCLTCRAGFQIVMSNTTKFTHARIQESLGVSCVASNSTCPIGTYNSTVDRTCRTCAPGCASCNATRCFANCPTNCTDCFGTNVTQVCLACNASTRSLLYQGKCFDSQCSPAGYFLNSTTKNCDNCPFMCDTCNSTLNCLNCTRGYYLNTLRVGTTNANYCTASCPGGQFVNNATRTCGSCSIGCNSCTNATACQVCNKYTLHNATDGGCYCDFRYQVVPSFESGSLLVDTFNLNWKATSLNKTQGCRSYFTFTLARNFQLRALDDLRCTAQLLKFTGQDDRVRIQVTGWTPQIQAAILRQQLNITLVKDNFSQDCRNHAQQPYQLHVPINATADIFTPAITLASASTQYLRCQNFSVNVTGLRGFTSGMGNPVWNITVIPRLVNQTVNQTVGNRTTLVNVTVPANYTSDLKALNNFIKLALTRPTTGVVIGTNIAQLFTDLVTLNISVSATNDVGVGASTFILITVRGYVDEVAPAAPERVFFNVTSDVFTVRPLLTTPKCPIDGNRVFYPSSNLTLNCSLLNSTRGFIKNLVGCTLRPSDNLLRNQTYFINYTTVPGPFQGAISGQVIVNTQIRIPTCTVNGPARWVIAPVDSLNLTARVANQDPVPYFYRWNCSNTTSSREVQCPFNSNATVVPSYNISRNSLLSGRNYTFTMHILNAQQEVISSCQKVITVAQPCTRTNLTLESNATNALNFLDSTVEQNIICAFDQRRVNKTSGLTFEWTVSERGSSVNLLRTLRPNQIRANGRMLTIFRNTLALNRDYIISCSLSSVEFCGNVSSNYTTRRPTTPNFNFTVFPTTGVAYQTNFTFFLGKISNANHTRCSFGYVDSFTGTIVNLNVNSTARNHSNANETFVTQLPATAASNLIVSAICTDIYSLNYTYTRSVTVSNLTNSTLSQAQWNAIIRNSSINLSVPQILLLSGTVHMNRNSWSNDSVPQGYLKVAESISRLNATLLSTIEIDQLTRTLSNVITNILTNRTHANNTRLVLSASSALCKLLYGTSRDTVVAQNTSLDLEVVVPLAFQAVSVPTFTILANTVDLLLETNLGIDTFAIVNQNLIKGLQSAASRIAVTMQVGDAGFTNTVGRFIMSVRKVSKASLNDNGVQLNVSSVANRTIASSLINLDIPVQDSFSHFDNLVVRAVIANATLRPVSNSTNSSMASNIILITSETNDYTNFTSGAYVIIQVEVRNLTRPFVFTIPLPGNQPISSNVINQCVNFNDASRRWVTNQCNSTTRIEPSQAACCSYYTLRFLSLQQMSVETQSEEQLSSLIIPALALLVAIIAIAGLFKLFISRAGKQADVHHELPSYDQSGEVSARTIDDTTVTA